jgi:hypothetical protein
MIDADEDQKVCEWIAPVDILKNPNIPKLLDIVVIGTEANGDSFVSSSYGKIADVIYLLERAKRHLLELAEHAPVSRPTPGGPTQ